jgi:hypothetical protein
MNAMLLVILGKTTKRKLSLRLPAVLGRSREADVTVAHPLISRRHCQIFESNGLLMLHDLGSLNGTMIGGRRIESATLLPNSEFMIGPLTFRVVYEYNRPLDVVIETRFTDGTDVRADHLPAASLPSGTARSPAASSDDSQPAGPDSESEIAMPDFMALADAEAEELIPSEPATPASSESDVLSGSKWPPRVARDKLPTIPLPEVLREPLEVDSSLQSGNHLRESPWAAEPPLIDKLRPAAPASGNRGPPAQPEVSAEAGAGEEPAPPPVAEDPPQKNNPPARKKPKPANLPKRASYGEEIDPEFGSFLEGLQ